MNKKKIDIESTEPINRAAEIDEVVAAFEKRGGYITIEEDFRIRKRISNRAHLSYWIGYVKSKLVYKKQKIAKHVSDAHASIKEKVAVSTIVRPLVKVKQEVKTVIKRSLNVNRYSDIYKDDPGLRPYQQKAKKEIFETWDEVDNVMLQMPTGSGKTRLFTSIISDINNYSIQRKEPVKILIVAHRKELINQIGKALMRYRVPNNLMDEGKERDYRYPVVVTSIQTITHPKNLQAAEKLNVKFIIIDEAHHALAATYKKLWDMYPDSKKLGVTATPWRMNHQSFTDLFDKLVLSMPIKDFINQGYLAPYKYYSLRSDSDILNTINKIELDKFGDYKEESMEKEMDIGTIRAQLLDSYQSLAKGKKGIIYAINIKHARHIANEYEKAGYKAVCIDSKTPSAEREDYDKKFKRGEIDIIVNVDIYSEGYDCPDIEFIQLARPTRSLIKYLQQVGRGLRPTENKEHCIILDNVGMYSNFGLPDANRPWELYFFGTNAEKELQRAGKSSESESERFVDFSEGTEEMELIQDAYDDVEVLEQQPEPIDVSPVISKTSSGVNDFFPILGVTLGKTTWQDIRVMGYKVKKDKIEDARYALVEKVAFWDNDGEGIFNSLYWVRDDNDFPALWKSRGFSWEKSYDEWMNVFKNLGYNVTIKKQATINKYTLVAEFEALSPDGSLLFDLYFNDGTDGCYTSSHKTLYSITVEYKGVISEIQDVCIEERTEDAEPIVDSEIVDEPDEAEDFNPMSKLLENNYANNNFVFWDDDSKKVYEAYIQDDTFYIISELIVDDANHCVHRKRVGKISGESWMFWQMMREKVDNLKSIVHYGAKYTLYHYRVQSADYVLKDKYFDYKGREIDTPGIVKEKYDLAAAEGKVDDYIDVPVSKAEFEVDLLGHTASVTIIRKFKDVTKTVAVLHINSDFGRKYFNLGNTVIHVNFKRKIKQADYDKLKSFKPNSCCIFRSDYKTITIRSNEGGKSYLYNYDLNGKLIKRETIVGNSKNQLPVLENKDIEKLWHVFDKKASTYKYFWLMSILKMYKNTGNASIKYEDILVKMVSCAWQYVFDVRYTFPKIDQLPRYLKRIQNEVYLDRWANEREIENAVIENFEDLGFNSLLTPLLNNVPYRFLSPWIPFTNNAEVMATASRPDIKCVYSIYGDHLTIKPEWRKYIDENYNKIVNFIERELRAFLKSGL